MHYNYPGPLLFLNFVTPLIQDQTLAAPALALVKGETAPGSGWSPNLHRVHSHVEVSTSGRPPPSRRDRSMSTITTSSSSSLSQETPVVGQIGSHVTTPATSMNSIEMKAKRRSVSTGGHLSVSPPSKTLKSDGVRAQEDTSLSTGLSPGMSEKPPVGFYTIAGSSRLRDREFRMAKSGVHVRFSSIDDRITQKSTGDAPARCHHLAAAPVKQAPVAADSEGGDPSQADQKQQQRIWFSPTGPQAVQRTQSNPEMECCPVCLARKECEILLKRTYSKVNPSHNPFAVVNLNLGS